VAQKKQGSRVPAAIGALPVVGDIVKSADQQAQWMQDVLEQQARLIGQLPGTLKTLNDSIERFNQTVGRLDRTVARIESATAVLTGPLAAVAAAVDPARLAELPEVLDSLRKEAVPALRAATDTQRQVARLQATVERVVAVVGELPGAAFVRRMTGGGARAEDRPSPRPSAEPGDEGP
jgi:ABC-type transporter Mla subunit MlaD